MCTDLFHCEHLLFTWKTNCGLKFHFGQFDRSEICTDVNAKNEGTLHRSKILPRNETSNRFEFTSGLMIGLLLQARIQSFEKQSWVSNRSNTWQYWHPYYFGVRLDTSFSMCWFLTLLWRRSLSYRNQDWICYANQWTGFHMIGTSVMKE